METLDSAALPFNEETENLVGRTIFWCSVGRSDRTLNRRLTSAQLGLETSKLPHAGLFHLMFELMRRSGSHNRLQQIAGYNLLIDQLVAHVLIRAIPIFTHGAFAQ
jgi:hypothetical protein